MKILRDIILTLTFTSMIFTGRVFAADSSIKELETKTNISMDKKWTIKFNFSLNKETINNDNVTVTDSKGNKINTCIMPGGTDDSVIVIPKTEGYIPANTYYLNSCT